MDLWHLVDDASYSPLSLQRPALGKSNDPGLFIEIGVGRVVDQLDGVTSRATITWSVKKGETPQEVGPVWRRGFSSILDIWVDDIGKFRLYDSVRPVEVENALFVQRKISPWCCATATEVEPSHAMRTR